MTTDPTSPTHVVQNPALVDRLNQESLLNLASDGRDSCAPPRPYTLPNVEELHAAFPDLEIIELIGTGGMGCVFRARQKKLDRMVALKVLPRELATDSLFAERFSREARAMARLNHPNIVSVYDFGQADDLHYLIMEYRDGMNLRELLEAGSLEPVDALRIFEQVCLALAYAHSEGVIHRDVKPENILFNKLGHVALADFGLARLALDSSCEISLTQTRQAMGTLNYMAPEQWDNPKAVDHRADIYALGVLLYESLTGRVPRGSFPPASTLSDASAGIDEVIHKALQVSPDDRYPEVAELIDDLAAKATADGAMSMPEYRFGEHGTVTNFLHLGAAVFDHLPRPGARSADTTRQPRQPAERGRPYTQLQICGTAFLIACLLIILPWDRHGLGFTTRTEDFMGLFAVSNVVLLLELLGVCLLTWKKAKLTPFRARLLILVLLGFCIAQSAVYVFNRSFHARNEITAVPFAFFMLVCLLALEFVSLSILSLDEWEVDMQSGR